MKIVISMLIILSVFSFGFEKTEKMKEIKIRWKKLPDLPEARRNLKAVCSGDRVFAMGGYAQPSKGPDPSLYVYNIPENTWSIKSGMITPRSNFALVSKKDKIYAIGGDKFLDKAECYDPRTDKWTAIPPLSIKRQHIFGCISGDDIYIAGGLLCWKCKPDEQLTAGIEVYNISTRKWRSLPDMPTPRQNALVSILGDKMYVMGGMDSTKVISPFEVFDPKSGNWEKYKDLPESGFYSGSVVFQNKIIILDGAKKDEQKTDVFVYYPEVKKWGKATPLPYPVKLTGFTINDDKLYVVGGCDSDFKAYAKVYEGTITD